jgi:hypothetical protein
MMGSGSVLVSGFSFGEKKEKGYLWLHADGIDLSIQSPEVHPGRKC